MDDKVIQSIKYQMSYLENLNNSIGFELDKKDPCNIYLSEKCDGVKRTILKIAQLKRGSNTCVKL